MKTNLEGGKTAEVDKKKFLQSKNIFHALPFFSYVCIVCKCMRINRAELMRGESRIIIITYTWLRCKAAGKRAWMMTIVSCACACVCISCMRQPHEGAPKTFLSSPIQPFDSISRFFFRRCCCCFWCLSFILCEITQPKQVYGMADVVWLCFPHTAHQNHAMPLVVCHLTYY